MNFCTICGNRLDENARFCTSCGQNRNVDLSQTAQPMPQPHYQSTPQETQALQSYRQPIPRQNQLPVYQPGAGSATASLILGIMGIVFMFFPFGIAAVILASSSHKKQAGANLYRLGTATGGMVTGIISIIYGVIGGIMIFLAFLVYFIEGNMNSTYFIDSVSYAYASLAQCLI